MKIGDLEVFSLLDGMIRLDGGAMFGVVPKVLWNRTNPADEKNRITLAMNCLLIIAEGKKILVDTGIGDKYFDRRKFVNNYGIERKPGLDELLRKHDLWRDDIDIVINTHLHFDHAGGNTTRDTDGKIISTFKNAKYFVQKGEFDSAVNAGIRTKGSYLEENFIPVYDEKKFELLEDDEAEIVKGVSVEVTPGHTKYHQVIRITSGGSNAVYLGDLIPTVTHIALPYVMGFDTEPLVTVETKEKLLDRAVEENSMLLFEHDPVIKAGYCTKKDSKYGFKQSSIDE